MTSKRKNVRAFLLESKDLSTCCVCFYKFNNGQNKPHSLPCLHTFCVVCLKGIVPNGENHVTCPKCKRVYMLPGGAVTDLPTNNFALNILQLLQDRSSRFWCLACDDVPEASCHSSHIVLNRSKDMEEICALLLVAATYSSDIVTLREKLHDHLKWQLQKKKVKAVQSLMAENRKCLEERRVLMENWAGMKIQSPDNGNDGFISFKKSLEKAIEEMKKESKQVGEMLHRSKIAVTGASLNGVESEQMLPLPLIINSPEEELETENDGRNETDSAENLQGAIALSIPNEVEGAVALLTRSQSNTDAALDAMGFTLETISVSTRRRRRRRRDEIQAVIPPYGFTLEWIGSSSQPLRFIELKKIGPEPILCLSFSPDGSFLASGGADNCVRLWRTRAILGGSGDSAVPIKMDTEHMKGTIFCVAVSPDNRRILSGGFSDFTVLIHDSETSKLLNRVATPYFPHKGCAQSGMSGAIIDISFQSGSEGNVFLPVNCFDTVLRIYDTRRPTRKEVIQLVRRTGHLGSAVFSPVDSNQLACSQSGHDIGVYIVDIRKPKSFLQSLPLEYTGGFGGLTRVEYSGDGNRLLCNENNESISVFDLPTSRRLDQAEKWTFPIQPVSCCFAGKDDELVVYSTDRQLSVWQLPDSQSLRTVADPTEAPLLKLEGQNRQTAIDRVTFCKSICIMASSSSCIEGTVKVWVPNEKGNN